MSRERPTEADRQQVRALAVNAAASALGEESMFNLLTTDYPEATPFGQLTEMFVCFITEGRWPA